MYGFKSKSKQSKFQDNTTPANSLDIKLVLKSLWPYLWAYKWRVFIALVFMVMAKIVWVAMPWAMKHIVDGLDSAQTQAIAVPFFFLFAYGFFRFGSVAFAEIRDAVFSRVTERAMRLASLEVFQHLHRMDLEFHLVRQTGGISRDIDRGTNGVHFLLRFLVFNIVPTLIELAMVATILFVAFNAWFSLITVFAVVSFIFFTVVTTEWRNKFIREANALDSQSNTRAIDSLLNYETVKYFGNEEWEANQYDENLANWEKARLKNRMSLLLLNTGQAAIISVSITMMMVLAAYDVVNGSITLGDLVMINAYAVQIFIPLNFLGFVYREIRRALTDIENFFGLLTKVPKIEDAPGAQPLVVKKGDIRFNNVEFFYHQQRAILRSFELNISAGEKVALVGSSGAGKSTIAKLLFRFYDPTSGQVFIDDQNIADVTQSSLRQCIGVVPQDTVLFNDTIFNNIRYGKPGASDEEVWKAIEMAHLDTFIRQLPEKENTIVGERGLKVSGGEKQRIAIARVLMKNPPILVFDEATSALDTHSESAILTAMKEVSHNRTAVVIAHRLSTIVDADNIVVISGGTIIEQGTFQQLISNNGAFATMWRKQNAKESV